MFNQLRHGSAKEAAEILDFCGEFDEIHLQAALTNALYRIDKMQIVLDQLTKKNEQLEEMIKNKEG